MAGCKLPGIYVYIPGRFAGHFDPLVDEVNSSKTHNDVNTLMEAILVCPSVRETDTNTIWASSYRRITSARLSGKQIRTLEASIVIKEKRLSV